VDSFSKTSSNVIKFKEKGGKAANRVIVEYANEFHQACNLKPL